MNRYRTTFFADCPNNGIRIQYHLEIVTGQLIKVEDILAATAAITRGYHEEIADQLLQSLGGAQTLTATHHGVEIETTRPALQAIVKPSEVSR
ncbi:hypothetical protein [Roseateles terrae]|uniref:Uncharacterized protein n=1 Tax=Roseateles terrae TaxID=431060 RepID=A0ABR6GQI5_9BURK|nr:hypothetical protein [Roseateles terrae]MBB3193966.1 hypothetical protein [Roseateles terrae]OWQ87842.1 hypothetical protein CDN98_06665 [Roseateles terrae]